ncbi:ABC transporter permease subunit [Paenibacillus durus]|uniref:ABC3 transporter permease protein domain-containing protein n=1 Tax=Paenibacillus durus TaxID=44251 RepID=A0A089HQB3_PAEDU|nr:ABC transporter permease subunit [Paenibacillus durus]AIQ14211.1 hypothetical protein PDUR_21570 [Paenibacillus durus]
MLIFKRNNIPIFILFVFLFLMTYTFQFYVNKQQMYEQLSNNLYTSNSSMLIAKGDLTWINEDLSKSQYRLFLEEDDTHRYLLKNNGHWSPPMISGDFLNLSERTKTAVIGREMEQYTRTISGVKYISYQTQSYEVIGIMGASFPSSVDYLILLHDPGLQLNDLNTKIVIDSDNPNVMKKILNRATKSDSFISTIDNFQKGFLRTGDAPFLYKFLLLEMYFLLLIGLISILRYGYEKEQKVINTLYMLGISKKNLYFEILIKNSVIIFLSSLISLFIFSGAVIFDSLALSKVLLVMPATILMSWIIIGVFIGRDHLEKKRGVVKR